MNTFQGLNHVNHALEDSCSGFFNGGQQSTLWIAHIEETPIAAIVIREKEKTLILKIRIYDIHLVKLNLQITPETVLIQGQPTEAAGVEGYFRPSRFESLIPLPHPVQPETYRIETYPDGLKIQLAKELRVPQSKVPIELPNPNSLDYLKMCL